MTHPFLTKLKVICKRFLGRCVYNWIYLKNKIIKLLQKSPKDLFSKQARNNLLTLSIRRWKLSCSIILAILSGYYGIGAFVSSDIDNRLNQEIKITAPQGFHGMTALNHVLKTQINDNAWTPALPIIFPASILDNLPNFQLGAKDAVLYYIKRYAKLYDSIHLQNAKELLGYPSDIWLMSQENFAPSTTKKYRNALLEIENFIHTTAPQTSTQDFLYLLKAINTSLKKQITQINSYSQEHSSDFMDTHTDDLFYRTQGVAYVTHYLLAGLTIDYQQQIVSTEQYENITTALKFLSDAVKLNPIIIKSGTLSDSYSANHLIYLAYYLLQAETHLKDVQYAITFQSMENFQQ